MACGESKGCGLVTRVIFEQSKDRPNDAPCDAPFGMSLLVRTLILILLTHFLRLRASSLSPHLHSWILNRVKDDETEMG